MEQRPKLEFSEVNKPLKLTLLFDDPIIGESQYGKYYLYSVRNGDNSEYSYFATEEVHEKIKDLRAGDSFEVTKIALKSKNNKVVTTFDVKLPNREKENKPVEPHSTNYYSEMEKSFEEALRLQNKFNGMANVNQIAITLFIQRTRGNHFFTS